MAAMGWAELGTRNSVCLSHLGAGTCVFEPPSTALPGAFAGAALKSSQCLYGMPTSVTAA